jgi:hypothetical protein
MGPSRKVPKIYSYYKIYNKKEVRFISNLFFIAYVFKSFLVNFHPLYSISPFKSFDKVELDILLSEAKTIRLVFS